ncbi:MAG: hypothetical protein JW852_03830 [Spirochaetales bacterium]|nr:hypothetical protein [Spirochaetales bacterium]
MWDLSLHLFDLMENSIRAGASTVAVTIAENRESKILTLVVEDDGPGEKSFPAEMLDPALNKKPKDKKKQGIPLLRSVAEDAKGGLTAAQSPLGGVAVVAMFRLNLIDAKTWGNVPATFESVAGTNPSVEIRCHLRLNGKERTYTNLNSREVEPVDTQKTIGEARQFADQIQAGLEELGIGTNYSVKGGVK